MWALAVALLAGFACKGRAQLQCDVQVSQGIPWTADNQTFNWLNLQIATNGGFPAQLPWLADVFSNGDVAASLGWKDSDGAVTDYWRPLVSGGSNNISVVIGSPQDPSIEEVYVGDENCSVGLPQTVSIAGGVQSGIRPVSISGTELIGVDGEPLQLKGINYFGFETPGGQMVDGLWITPDSITLDFPTIVYRLQLLGYNAVRLPFDFKNLYGPAPQSFTQSCNTLTQATLVAATTDPSVTPTGEPPVLTSSPTQTPGVCNSDLPNGDVLERFLYVVRFFANNGFYVLIDDHLNYDTTAIENPTLWAERWADLATQISQDPDTAAYVMMDILNEPDSQKLRWEAVDGLPSTGDLYLAGMQAIYDVNPNFLFFIEGVGQIGQAICWVRLVFWLMT